MTRTEAAGLLFMYAGLEVEPARILFDAATREQVIESAEANVRFKGSPDLVNQVGEAARIVRNETVVTDLHG